MKGRVEMAATRKKLTVQPKGGKPLDEAFDQFIQSKTVMNLSEETIKHYQVCYKYFKDFFGERSKLQ